MRSQEQNPVSGIWILIVDFRRRRAILISFNSEGKLGIRNHGLGVRKKVPAYAIERRGYRKGNLRCPTESCLRHQKPLKPYIICNNQCVGSSVAESLASNQMTRVRIPACAYSKSAGITNSNPEQVHENSSRSQSLKNPSGFGSRPAHILNLPGFSNSEQPKSF